MQFIEGRTENFKLKNTVSSFYRMLINLYKKTSDIILFLA